MQSQIQGLLDAVAEALLPPPALLVSEWARQHFKLSADYSSATGHFQPYPYQVEPLDVLSPSHPADTIVLCTAAQMTKTLLMLIFLGYVIDVDPGPVLIVQPRAEDADSFSKERIAPMVRDVPRVAAKVVEAKSRDTGNTILQKKFLGGTVSLTGALSPSGLRRRSVRYLFLDEVDGYEETSDGDPIALAAARTSKFWNRKIVLCSTPTIEGRSRIVKAYEDSDQRQYFVPCPFCGHEQVLDWANVRWGLIQETGEDIAPVDAHYQCAGCSALIPHHHKFAMLRDGKWKATNPDGKFPGFKISRLYAPDWSWGKVVTDPLEGFLQAKSSTAAMRAFKNNLLAETFREPGEAAPNYELLRARAVLDDEYELGQVPVGPLFLTCGVDVQKSWLEGYVWGWGRGKQRWCIDHFRIEHGPYDPLAWSELTDQINRTYRHPSGAELTIVRCAIDTGHESNQVYAWARQHGASRVLAVDGRSSGVLIAPPTMVDLTVGGRRIKHGCKLWGVNVSACKSELYGQLNLPAPASNESYPPGWIHFPSDLSEEFYRQLTSEEFRLSVRRGGVRTYHWEPIENRRQESLDCANYARAAASNVGIDKHEHDNRWWANLEGQLKTVYVAPVSVKQDEKESKASDAISAPRPATVPATPVRYSPPVRRRVFARFSL